MDLVLVPARWLAEPIARVLGADGKTRQDRRDELMQDLTLSGDDIDDLGLRHITRSAAWFVILAAGFFLSMAVAIPISLFAKELSDPAFFVSALFSFFLFFMACLHAVKALIVHYLPEHWWNPRSRVWRVAMLAQLPDLVIALALAYVVAASVVRD
ncbi:hypothetical protein GA0074695_5838 [Micromonospora viridifaciens]|uniref:Uncharacterized protein n=1 Tax=Micromonospora viridifaciens TaxID=1881 RepID=A0A1C4ZMK0_MICVI|nr:hypothetical protein [Micromonospora viridifaciens]SCF34327.1 hypothetical protein GA0074695_5838 [Micromonospora viridifaciens]